MLLNSCLRILPRFNFVGAVSSFNRITSPAAKSASKWFHSSAACQNHNLMEFFDLESNWGADEVKTGRSWKLDELRNKSNQDLHKLWYVLLKEKNMLLTMEEFYKEEYVLFPSPERIDKVEESMINLETVVRERNKAYFMLETGEDGERPGVMVHTAIGLPVYHKKTQHVVPKVVNKWWKETFTQHFDMDECRSFLSLYREKERHRKAKGRRQHNKHGRNLLKRYKNIDMKYFKELYPDIKQNPDGTIEDEIKGHYSP